MIAVIGRFSSAACFPTIFSFFPRWPVFSSPSLSPLSFLCSVLFWLVFLVHLLFRRIYESFLYFPQSVIVIRQSTRIFHIIYHIIPYNSIHPSLRPFTAHHRFCSALLICVAPSSVFVLFLFVSDSALVLCFRARQLYILRSFPSLSPSLHTPVSNSMFTDI